ncbi:serpin family protein [Nocardiopsis sp. CNT312]|uniref:serpin family protein n=1 Tax=Nocardiopsis sp. CNT312 TaxID=1137268 RepID=UPI00048DE909|nr:serpin family protein [Nocardiopsis sp. CNT312]
MHTPVRRDHLEFAAALDRALARPRASHVWSPYSVGTVLCLLAAGSSGGTRDELESLLGADPHALLTSLDGAAGAQEGPELAAFNGLYIPDGLAVRPAFTELVRARPAAEVRGADVRGDPEGVRRRINAKAAEATRGLVPELLPPGSVGPDVRMLLANALWAKVVWACPFEVRATRARRFHAPGGDRTVPAMHREGDLTFARARGWRMVSLRGEHDLALDVLLAQGRDAVPDADTLEALYRARRRTPVRLALPRFAVRTGTGLLEPLARLGVRTLATDAARFDGISGEPLKVDALLHQAVMRVDEKGAEGAAATAAVMVRAAAAPTRPVDFTVDRPFSFALRRGGTLLFLGRVADPEDPGPARG